MAAENHGPRCGGRTNLVSGQVIMLDFTGTFKHSKALLVRLTDLTPLGFAFNYVHQVFFVAGFVDYTDTILLIGQNGRDPYWVVAKNTVEFYEPIFLDTQVRVETRIPALGRKSFIFEQQIVGEQDDKIHSRNQAVMVCYSGGLNKSIAVPDLWRVNVYQYEEKVVSL